MKIHEYQGKEILRQFGVPVPRGIPAFTVQEAVEAAQKLGGPVWVVKAQIHAGGRGKGGGVKLGEDRRTRCKPASPARSWACSSKTHQTGPEPARRCAACYMEEGADIKKRATMSRMVVDRAHPEGVPSWHPPRAAWTSRKWRHKHAGEDHHRGVRRSG